MQIRNLQIKEYEKDGLVLDNLPNSFFEEMGFDRKEQSFFIYQDKLYITYDYVDRVVAIENGDILNKIKLY